MANFPEQQVELVEFIGTNIKRLELRKRELLQGQENVKELQAVFDRHCYRTVHNLQLVLKETLKNVKKASDVKFKQKLNELTAAESVIGDKISELKELEKTLQQKNESADGSTEPEKTPKVKEKDLASLCSCMPSMHLRPELPCQSVLDVLNTLEIQFISADEQKKEPSVLPPPKIEEGCEKSIYVSSRLKDGTFWAVLAPEEGVLAALNHMSLCIRDRYVRDLSWQTCEESGCQPAVGDFVYAQFPVDKKWYRARIFDISSLITVIYLDYGNTHTVKRDQIIVPEEDLFKSSAYQAMECTVFETLPESVPLPVRFTFNEMVMAVDVTAKFIRQVDWSQDRPVWYTELTVYDQQGARRSVNEEVLKTVENEKQGQSSIGCRDVRLMENPSLEFQKVVERPKESSEEMTGDSGSGNVSVLEDSVANVPCVSSVEAGAGGTGQGSGEESKDLPLEIPEGGEKPSGANESENNEMLLPKESPVDGPLVSSPDECVNASIESQSPCKVAEVSGFSDIIDRTEYPGDVAADSSVQHAESQLPSYSEPSIAVTQLASVEADNYAIPEDAMSGTDSVVAMSGTDSVVPTEASPKKADHPSLVLSLVPDQRGGRDSSPERQEDSKVKNTNEALMDRSGESSGVELTPRGDPDGEHEDVNAPSHGDEVSAGDTGRKMSTSSEGSDRNMLSAFSGEDAAACGDRQHGERGSKKKKKKSSKSRDRYKEDPGALKPGAEVERDGEDEKDTRAAAPNEKEASATQGIEVPLKVRVVGVMDSSGEFPVQCCLSDQDNVHFTEFDLSLQKLGHFCIKEWYEGCGTDVVLANDNSSWKRAKIHEILTNKKRVIVRYLDYGKTATVPVSNVKLMEENVFGQVMAMKHRAMWCVLQGWQKVPKEDVEQLKNDFKILTTGKILSLSIVDPNTDPCVVHLSDETDPGNVVDIGQKICGAFESKRDRTTADLENPSNVPVTPRPTSASVMGDQSMASPQSSFPISHWEGTPSGSPDYSGRQSAQFQDRKKRSQEWKAEGQTESADTNQSWSNGSSSGGRLSEGRSMHMNNIQCFLCKEIGHIRSQCPLIGQVEPSDLREAREVLCYQCNESGHIKSQCPKELNDIQCYNCLGMGHYKSNCPQDPQKRHDRGGEPQKRHDRGRDRRHNHHGKGGHRARQREPPSQDWGATEN